MTSETTDLARPDPIEAVYPLTPVQEGMLFHTVSQPGSGVYVEQLAFRAGADFSPQTFRRAVDAVMRRHPILRTGFSWERREEPLQVVLEECRLPVQERDWSGLSEAEVDERFGALLAKDRQRGFDLSKPPALRLRILGLGASGYLCLLSYHHILLDAWSLALVFGEILTHYRRGGEAPAAELASVVPFRTFVDWLGDRDPEDERAFWRRHLRGIDGPTRLPLDGQGPEGASGHGDLRASLSAETTRTLTDLASSHGVTPAVVAQAAWALVLAAFSGSDDVLFGAAVAGRPPELPGAEAMIGLFINTVPVRLRLDPRRSLLDWLARWQREQAERSEAVHLPLVEIRRLVGLPRDEPLFDSLVVFENVPVDRRLERAEEAGLSLHGIDYRPQTHYPLSLLIVPERQLTLRLLVRFEVYEPEAARRLLDSMVEVLERMAARPRARLGSLIEGLGIDRRSLEARLSELPGVRRGDLHPPAWGESRWSLQIELEAPLAEGSELEALPLRIEAALPRELAGRVETLWITRGASAAARDLPVIRSRSDSSARSARASAGTLELPVDRLADRFCGRFSDRTADGSSEIAGEPASVLAQVEMTLPAAWVRGAEARAEEGEASLEMLLAAVLAVLLGRLTGSRQPAFLIEESRAPAPSGPWAPRHLTLAPSVDGGLDALELLREVRHQWLAARVGADDAPSERARPGFVLSFTGRSAAAPPVGLVDLVFERRGPGGLVHGRWCYDPERHDATTLQRWSAAYQRLLAAMSAPQPAPLAAWPWLGPAERHQLTREWNDTLVAGAGDDLPHRAFERHAASHPDDRAVVVGEGSLSYGELDRWANRLAHRLQRLGVGPDVSVGICLDPCGAMVAAFLAVLKAGGTHVPLDPAYPSERLDYMVADAGIAVLMVTPESRGRLTLAGAVPVLDLGHGPEDAPAEPDFAPVNIAVPGNLGYVIYTSGSTGRPKGVALSYAVMTNLTRWQLGLTPLAPGGRTLQFTSFSFDVAVLELLAPLSSAGVLVLFEDGQRRDLAAIARLLVRQRIERLILPFTALEHLAEHLQGVPVDDVSLRWLVSTGEALQITPAVADLLRRLPGTVLFNGYGPSETHFVTDYRLPESDPGGWPPMPPIGRPIPNGRIYIVDPAGEALPVGVAGEMWLGGLPVARCYLRRPRATAEKFLPDPWGEAGGRLYRSGDLARFLPDGNIEFLGRIDHQVKVRGFRVELGEIEIA
ncbi:MAG: amino acid adenylation domain-containing protein, partial [Acidobacteria bacterium]|nr:amino acid adenylation domain-containing protein [Acidobacteriota bacterium]